jgi:hypothetical protein
MRWLREPYSPLEGPLLLPIVAGTTAAPLLFALIACTHELITGATGEPLLRIAHAYLLYLTPFSIQFSLLLGLPLVLIWDRLLCLPRAWFVLAAALAAAGFAAFVGLGAAWLPTALAGAANAAAFLLAGDWQRRRLS